MANINRLYISPPLMNSASAWASDEDELKSLYNSKFTGGVTTRTATLHGFPEDSTIHTVAFSIQSVSSVNSYGYSPHPLAQYLLWAEQIITVDSEASKPIIISITTSDRTALSKMFDAIQNMRTRVKDKEGETSRVAVEFNVSCPNIADAPPPSYEFASLVPLLEVAADYYWKDQTLTVGLKLPPYVYSKQFVDVVGIIASLSRTVQGVSYNPISFLTSTNTLGTSLLYRDEIAGGVPKDPESAPHALPTVLGGLAGESIHALSLGNVYSFSQLLTAHHDAAVRKIALIGVGGVTTPDAVKRMRRAGANVVACATLLGREGVRAFEKLSKPSRVHI